MRTNILLVTLLAAATLLPATASAGSPKPLASHCPPRYSCNASIGFGLRVPPNWLVMPAGKEGSYTVAFARRPVTGPSYDERLIVKLVMVGSSTDSRALVGQEANRLVTGLHASKVTMTAVRYGGASGLLLRGLPPTPSPATDIVLAHNAYVYLLIAPGRGLAADQQQALNSLRFFVPQAAPPPGNNQTRLSPPKMIALYFADLNAHRSYAAWSLEAPCGVQFSVSNGRSALAGSEGYSGKSAWTPPEGALAAHPLLASARVRAIRQLHIPVLNRNGILAFAVSGVFKFDYTAATGPSWNNKHRSGFHVIKIGMWKCGGRWWIEPSYWMVAGGGELSWT